MAAPGTKPCCKCGAPVADAALGRGALEDPDGRRYCSPCAGQVLRSDRPEAGGLKAVNVRAARPGSVVSRAAKPAQRKATSTRSAPQPKAPQVQKSGNSAPKAPAASAGTIEPARPEAGKPRNGASQSRRISRRVSARANLPWYAKMGRGQIVGLFIGAALAIALAAVGVTAACRVKGNKNRGTASNMNFGSGAQGLIAEADYLASKGQYDQALARLRQAQDSAGAAADGARKAAAKARAAGQAAAAQDLEDQARRQESLAVEANRRIFGINKGTVIHAQ